jgi:hypothetical protein
MAPTVPRWLVLAALLAGPAGRAGALELRPVVDLESTLGVAGPSFPEDRGTPRPTASLRLLTSAGPRFTSGGVLELGASALLVADAGPAASAPRAGGEVSVRTRVGPVRLGAHLALVRTLGRQGALPGHVPPRVWVSPGITVALGNTPLVLRVDLGPPRSADLESSRRRPARLARLEVAIGVSVRDRRALARSAGADGSVLSLPPPRIGSVPGRSTWNTPTASGLATDGAAP